MEEYYSLLQRTQLFKSFTGEELARLLPALPATCRQYQRGEALLLAGYESREIGVVLTGAIEATKQTRAGESFTVSRMGPGGVFGDVLSGSNTKSPVTVTTPEGCTVLRIPYAGLLGPDAGGDLQRRLVQNLVGVVSDKYFALDRRMDLLLTRGLRRRVAAYLLGEAEAAGADTFTIPFNRTALAAYLGCERTALAREVSRMAAEGLIDTYRQSFRLLQPAALRALL